ncbi:MAG: hypothetical protein RMJ84_05370, partial [Sandaracinaceae bacterium]|nr:hypothetical protein [Sandaracinaceae bacterium]
SINFIYESLLRIFVFTGFRCRDEGVKLQIESGFGMGLPMIQIALQQVLSSHEAFMRYIKCIQPSPSDAQVWFISTVNQKVI